MASHVMSKCQHCKKDFEAGDLAPHEDGCVEKPKKCEFCELQVAFDKYDTHVYTCGSRTKYCHTCKKLIVMKGNIIIITTITFKDYNNHTVGCLAKIEKQ